MTAEIRNTMDEATAASLQIMSNRLGIPVETLLHIHTHVRETNNQGMPEKEITEEKERVAKLLGVNKAK